MLCHVCCGYAESRGTYLVTFGYEQWGDFDAMSRIGSEGTAGCLWTLRPLVKTERSTNIVPINYR
ncbi:hypothetical protein KIMH_12770 [Bombiscardovia apis]|uniref:Uncharacterized protein n=1 Tax=Bombiscardovia apis TaxID=2932182 RepID=A0ABM8BE44_9BIFI|nr:hypothetical protein KIMH_12770 [Bombiscardovia apis]